MGWLSWILIGIAVWMIWSWADKSSATAKKSGTQHAHGGGQGGGYRSVEQHIINSGDRDAMRILQQAKQNPNHYRQILTNGANRGNSTLKTALMLTAGVVAGGLLYHAWRDDDDNSDVSDDIDASSVEHIYTHPLEENDGYDDLSSMEDGDGYDDLSSMEDGDGYDGMDELDGMDG